MLHSAIILLPRAVQTWVGLRKCQFLQFKSGHSWLEFWIEPFLPASPDPRNSERKYLRDPTEYYPEKSKQFQNANFRNNKKTFTVMELYWAWFSQCHLKNLFGTVRRLWFWMGNQYQQTACKQLRLKWVKPHSHPPQTCQHWEENSRIVFQYTVLLVTIHNGISFWAPITSWRYADTSTARWPLLMWIAKPTSDPLTSFPNILNNGISVILLLVRFWGFFALEFLTIQNDTNTRIGKTQ